VPISHPIHVHLQNRLILTTALSQLVVEFLISKRAFADRRPGGSIVAAM